MSERLCQLLDQLNVPDLITKTEEEIENIKGKDLQAFFSSLIDIFTNANIKQELKNSAILFAWKCFPEDLSKLPEDKAHPFDELGCDLVDRALNESFSLIFSFPTEFKHFPSALYAIIASLYVHRNFDSGIINKLSETLMSITNNEDVKQLSMIISQILGGYSPEEDEISNLVTSTFSHLTSTDNIDNCISVLTILEAIVENITDLLEVPEVLDSFASSLLALCEIDNSICSAFKCWKKVAKFAPNIIAIFAQAIVIYICQAIEKIEDNSIIIEACVLLKKITKLELLDQSEELNSIKENSQLVLLSLASILCRVSTDEIPSSETWDSHIAAFQALKVVAQLCSNEEMTKLVEVTSQFVSSENFAERDAGLRILSCIIESSKDPLFFASYVNEFLSLCKDQAPCVRFRAFRCIKKGIQKISDSSSEYNDLPLIVEASLGLVEHLNDEPQIVSEITSLFALLVKLYSKDITELVFNEIFSRAIHMRQSFTKNPFNSIHQIIQTGDKNVLLSFLPQIIELFIEAQGSETHQWLVHDLSETIQVYALNLGNSILPYSENAVRAMFQLYECNNEYSCDSIITIAAIASAIQSMFLPYLDQFLAILESSLSDPQTPDYVYASSISLSMLIKAKFEIPNIHQFLLYFISIISDFTISTSTRRAILQSVADIFELNKDYISEFSEQIVPLIEPFAQGLKVQVLDDKIEAQLMGSALSQCLLYIMEATGKKNSKIYVPYAKEIILFMSEIPSAISRFMISVLNIILFISKNYSNEMLIIIDDNPQVGEKIVDSKTFDTTSAIASEILRLLKFK